jgi:c-di-GMP-binding flagellar brake protein YcgR
METRSSVRAAINIYARLNIDDGFEQKISLPVDAKLRVNVVSISSLGMGFLCTSVLPKGLKVKIDMPGDDFGISGNINLSGEIRYCRQVTISSYNCGLKFIDISPDHKAGILRYVSLHSSEKRKS